VSDVVHSQGGIEHVNVAGSKSLFAMCPKGALLLD